MEPRADFSMMPDVISSHAAACTAHDVAKFSAVSQMSQTSLASNSTESSLLQGIPVNHFHDHNSKYISKEALAILNRGPLLSPMLLSLLEPHRENYVDTEFQKTLTRPPPLPTVWSRELDRLYHSLTEEDWMVLVDEEGRVITLLQVARFPMFGFSKNTKKRLDLCEAIDRVDAGFTGSCSEDLGSVVSEFRLTRRVLSSSTSLEIPIRPRQTQQKEVHY